jgi:hypothetical protein
MESTSCISRGNDINLGINVYIQVLLLFTILSMLFIHVISKVETSAINDELQDLVSDNMIDNYQKLDNEDKQKIKSVLNLIDLNVLDKMYDKEDTARRLNNEGVYRSIYIALTLIVVAFIIGLALNKGLCHKVPLKHLITENIIIFSCIGVVEFMFFKHIILKYVPTKPSFMSQYIVQKVKQTLNVKS